jgi:VanZ family protein
MHVFVKYWLPLLIWLCVIFVGSTDVLSARHTSRFIVPILLWLKPGMRPQTILSILIVMRKSAHVAEYAILALLLWRALRSARTLRTKMSIVFGAVLLACVVFAVSDEFHQSFVKSRTPTVRDVLLDGGGALFGLLIGVGFAKRDSKKVRSTARNDVVNARL